MFVEEMIQKEFLRVKKIFFLKFKSAQGKTGIQRYYDSSCLLYLIVGGIPTRWVYGPS